MCTKCFVSYSFLILSISLYFGSALSYLIFLFIVVGVRRCSLLLLVLFCKYYWNIGKRKKKPR